MTSFRQQTFHKRRRNRVIAKNTLAVYWSSTIDVGDIPSVLVTGMGSYELDFELRRYLEIDFNATSFIQQGNQHMIRMTIFKGLTNYCLDYWPLNMHFPRKGVRMTLSDWPTCPTRCWFATQLLWKWKMLWESEKQIKRMLVLVLYIVEEFEFTGW